jgi:hypothetical protein
VSPRQQIATGLTDRSVPLDVAKSVIVVPHLTTGLDDFYDREVPIVGKDGTSRTDCTGSTRRGTLELPRTRRMSNEVTVPSGSAR